MKLVFARDMADARARMTGARRLLRDLVRIAERRKAA
jgi:transcription-repair coupling factor (superfamily II helicase)